MRNYGIKKIGDGWKTRRNEYFNKRNPMGFIKKKKKEIQWEIVLSLRLLMIALLAYQEKNGQDMWYSVMVRRERRDPRQAKRPVNAKWFGIRPVLLALV